MSIQLDEVFQPATTMAEYFTQSMASDEADQFIESTWTPIHSFHHDIPGYENFEAFMGQMRIALNGVIAPYENIDDAVMELLNYLGKHSLGGMFYVINSCNGNFKALAEYYWPKVADERNKRES